MSIFFVLCVIALGILLVHLMLQTHFQYLPESIVTVCLGALIGLILNFTSVKTIFEREEVFSPTAFFLVLLPPIIFEVINNKRRNLIHSNYETFSVWLQFTQGKLLSKHRLHLCFCHSRHSNQCARDWFWGLYSWHRRRRLSTKFYRKLRLRVVNIRSVDTSF